jgi:Ala-tRNA(Pro) deacylase
MKEVAMGAKDRIREYLQGEGVSFEDHQHPEAFTSQEVAAAEHVPGRMVAKVVIVRADEDLIMLVLPAHHHVDLERASDVVGKEVRLATEKEFAPAFPDSEPGAMPPFGNLYGIPVYADRALEENETIVFEAGTHTDTISIAYADYERLAQPTVAGFSYVPGKQE